LQDARFTKMEVSQMRYEAFEDRKNPGDWRVEAINFASEGECYVAIFSGPDAQERAEEYAAWKMEPAHLVST
jgi:hypothetical protein